MSSNRNDFFHSSIFIQNPKNIKHKTKNKNTRTHGALCLSLTSTDDRGGASHGSANHDLRSLPVLFCFVLFFSFVFFVNSSHSQRLFSLPPDGEDRQQRAHWRRRRRQQSLKSLSSPSPCAWRPVSSRAERGASVRSPPPPLVRASPKNPSRPP